jgi:hypothetical protein
VVCKHANARIIDALLADSRPDVLFVWHARIINSPPFSCCFGFSAFLCLVETYVVAMQGGKKISHSHVLLSVGALRTAVWEAVGDYWVARVMGCKCLQNKIFAVSALEILRVLE